jgi:hypothetical protein
MRFVPLLSSRTDPAPWRAFEALELVWEGGEPGSWLRVGAAIHALHVPRLELAAEAAGQVLPALLALGADFLVLQAPAPGDLKAQSTLLRTLEVLLEVLAGRGPRLLLRPEPGAAPALARLLGAVRAEAVGYCWDVGVGADLEHIWDRIHGAVARPGDDLEPLARLGYRWNVAVPFLEPATAASVLARLAAEHPLTPFPLEVPMPDTDLPLTWGSAWGGTP